VTRPVGVRRAAWLWGRRGERLAALWLCAKGYRILARHWRAAGAEIDLIVRRGSLLAAVEVKARPDAATAATALGEAQRRRIARAARAFLGRHPELAGLDLRFDVVLVVPGRRPRHIIDAWREDGP